VIPAVKSIQIRLNSKLGPTQNIEDIPLQHKEDTQPNLLVQPTNEVFVEATSQV